jgi:hypothetical protein
VQTDPLDHADEAAQLERCATKSLLRFTFVAERLA